MKKIRVSRKKPSVTPGYQDHNTRRTTLGIALVLLGVLTVLNLLVMHKPGSVNSVQADVYQTQ